MSDDLPLEDKSWWGRTAHSLSVRNFRLYFIGQLCSIIGSNAQVVALGWLVLERTGSGAALGLVMAAQYLPLLVIGPLLGPFVNRSDHRRIILWTQAVEIAMALLLGVLALWSRSPVWLMGVASFILGVAYCIDFPARQLLIRRMVGDRSMPNAVALHNLLFGAARTIGPAIAGILITQVSLVSCFFVNAASYGVVIFSLVIMRESEFEEVAPKLEDRSTIREGFQYIRRVPAVRSGLLIMAIAGTLTYEYWVTIPVLVRNVFHGSASLYANSIVVMSIGTVLGAALVASRKTVGKRDVLVATPVYGLMSMFVGLSPTVAVFLFAMLLMGVSYSAFVSLSNSVLQLNTDIRFHGSVNAIWTAAFVGSTAVGGPLMGWFAQHVGARPAIVFGGAAAVGAAAIGNALWSSNKVTESKVAGATTSGSAV